MKRTVNLLLIGFLIQSISFAQTYQWAHNIGSGTDDFGYCVAVDDSSNVYITGAFVNTADFDPGPGTANLTSAGSADIFFAKYSTSGGYIWAKNIGGGLWDDGYSIAVDDSGNVYVAGRFQGTADFDPGPGTANLTSAGGFNVFFAKYNAFGDYLWANIIGTAQDAYCFGIDVDNNGNVYITGWFSGTADFDPGSGTANLTTVGANDIFIAKYSISGGYLWAKSFGDYQSDIGQSVTVDGIGNVYITGRFQYTIDFDPGPDSANLTAVSAGAEDIFFAKYDSSGDYLWAKSIGSASVYPDGGQSITVDDIGNVYICGYFQETADFDPGVGTANLTSAGMDDIFFAKYSSLGEYIWAKSIGSDSLDLGYSISVDASSNVYIGGMFAGVVDFDPGAGIANLGGGNTFFAKYSNSGDYLWAASVLTPFGDNGDHVTVDDNGNVYVAGWFGGTIDFDPGPGTADVTAVGGNDIFLAKYSQDIISASFTQSEAILTVPEVYPNPNTGEFVIKINIKQIDNIAITIYNSMGQVIFREELVKFKGSYEKRLKLDEYPAGIYNIQLMTSKGAATRQVIIQ